ncbi:ArsR/SmtB family transcription factor [Seleniivibrio woodruffii]|uniref:ArsR family transcriptional regulator n=1 Tax=Seleniivibrio woodruffii TaxID=1078050 RepID=A0A4R1KDK2_9BACT|nr:metalloregulator ArsR/SmtB family transcription factor [Seleniivibrio woodruffii]TCK62652.1 ArsR family transcriptional regulator [Seleniivibrio woodruffii]TVZ36922.1 ArsR family transcriptional regulator [Seleniivibrio woodruffii]
MTQLDSAVEIIKSIADRNRMRILLMLNKRPMCVCELDAVLGIALSTISAHLKQMRSAGVITSEKDGRWVIYRISDDTSIRTIVSSLSGQLYDDTQVVEDLKMIDGISREECAKK